MAEYLCGFRWVRRGHCDGEGHTENVLEGLTEAAAADKVLAGALVGGGGVDPFPLERCLPLAQVCGKSRQHKG